MDRVSFGAAPAALTLYFLNPFPASSFPTCQALRRGSIEGRSSRSKPFRKWAFYGDGLFPLSPSPSTYSALSLSLPHSASQQHPPIHATTGRVACRPRCAKRGRKKGCEGDRASAEKGALLLSPLSPLLSVGPARKRLLFLLSSAAIPLFSRELWRCYGPFLPFGFRGSRACVFSEKDCKSAR